MSTDSGYLIDTSVAIAMWREMYPPENFPTFYVRMRQKFLALNIHFARPVFDEIEYTQEKLEGDDLRAWLEKISDEKEGFIKNSNQRIDERADELNADYSIEKTVELIADYPSEDDTDKEGVDRNDLLLIAMAKEYGFTIVTQEKEQSPPPKKKEKYKIPAVCQKEEVRCINLIEFIKEIKLVV